jgi:spermidine synthase
LAALGGVVLGAGAVFWAFALGPELRDTEAVARWIRPARLLGVAALLGLCAALGARAGLVRSSATLGLVWATIAAWWTWLRPGLAPWRWASGALFLGNAALLGASPGLAPPADLARFPAEVVYARATDRGHFVVTSAQEHFNLFVGGQLEVSTLDQHRYYEALVHPAMQTARERRRVLLLGGGKGPAEREIFRYPEVSELTVVLIDRTLFELGRQMRWLDRLSGGALGDARLRVVEAEPLVWLGQGSDQFDVALVDLPDPDGYFPGKNFTRSFYRALRRRVRPAGAVAVQATSLGRSPQSFALIDETLVAAGWRTLRYHVPIVSLGDWGFVLASQATLHPPEQVPAGLRFLTPSVLGDLFRLPRDLPSRVASGPNVLYDQRLVDLFEQEQAQ